HVDAMKLLDMTERRIELRRIARGNLARGGGGNRRGLILRHLRDRFTVREDAADGRVEPAVDRGSQKVAREEKENQHRNQRGGHPGDCELRAESRADDAAL